MGHTPDAAVRGGRRTEAAAAWVDGCVEVSEMTETLQRPAVVSRERHHLAADAFLAAAFIFLVVIGAQELIAYLLSGGEMGTWTPPVWLEVIGALGLPLAVIGGPVLAWLLYGRHIGWRDLVVAVVGGVVGGALLGVAFMAVFFATRLLPIPFPREGPWELVIISTLAAVAFLAQPVIVAVRDLAGTKEHVRRHSLRLAIVVLGLAAVIVSMFIGGETAELGMFMLLPAAPAALAVIAMDWWRAQQHRADAHPRTT